MKFNFDYITVEMDVPLDIVIEFIRNDNYNKVEESLQIEAVKEYPGCLEYMPRPSKAVAEAAIRHKPTNIGRIRKPTKELQLLAISLNPEAFEYMINPCKEAKTLAALLA